MGSDCLVLLLDLVDVNTTTASELGKLCDVVSRLLCHSSHRVQLVFTLCRVLFLCFATAQFANTLVNTRQRQQNVAHEV